MTDNKTVLQRVEMLLAASRTNRDWLRGVCGLLQRERKHYNWVGIYFLERNELALGPYVGEPSPHTRIPIDQGICGAAVREGQTVVVPDVNADPRYLPCSVSTQSEIVVPIIADGRILGEIDIDSNAPNAFTEADRELLEAVAERLGYLLAQTPNFSGQAPKEA